MLPSWERLLYFHIQPALLDGLLSFVGVVVLLRVFRVRNPSLRSLFYFIPLVRPLLILLEGAAQDQTGSNGTIGLRMPDPFYLIPFDIVNQGRLSTVSQLVALLIGVVLLAAIFFLVFRWVGFLAFYRRLRRLALPAAALDDRLSRLVDELSQQMGLARPPEIIMIGDHWATPCAIGWRKPALVFDPHIIDELNAAELRAVVAHELGHVKRRDGLWHWVSVVLRDIQSFSPFSHLSIARLELEREKACDSTAVALARVSPRVLAESLVKMSKLLSSQHLQPLPGYGSMGLLNNSGSLLEERIMFLLAMGNNSASVKANAKVGKLKLVILLAAWLPLVLFQLYFCIWLGGYAFVLK